MIEYDGKHWDSWAPTLQPLENAHCCRSKRVIALYDGSYYTRNNVFCLCIDHCPDEIALQLLLSQLP